jgi:hypothetical protein
VVSLAYWIQHPSFWESWRPVKLHFPSEATRIFAGILGPDYKQNAQDTGEKGKVRINKTYGHEAK